MKLLSTCTILLAVLAVATGNAQNFKFRKVSEAELLEKEHPIEKEAEAAYLYDYRNSYYTVTGGEISLTTEIQKRVKIYSDEGFPYAEFSIYLYDGNNGAEVLSGLRAYTYNLEDGSVEENKLDKDDIFEEEINEYRRKITFTMPKVKEGSVLEIKYKVHSSYFFNIDPFRFQYGIPVNKLEASFSAPDYFTFNTRNKGYYFINAETSRKNNPSTETTDVLYTFNRNNIPSLKEEAYVDNIDNYRSGVNFELSNINIPGSYYKSFTQTWEDVTKNIYDSGLETELRKDGYFKDELDPLLQKAPGALERIGVVFEFVKSKVNWNDRYGYLCSNGVRKAYKEGTGNVADINIMLTGMLRYAGLKANPVLVSTKSHGIPIFPTSDGFNYVVVAVEMENKVVLLDATSKLSVPNILPYRVLNWNGRLIREDGSSVSIDLSPSQKAQSVVSLSVELHEDGSADGKIRRHYTNHRAYGFRNEYVNVAEEEYLEDLENELSGIEIGNYAVENLKNPYKPVVENYDFHKDVAVEQISGKIFLSPMMFFSTSENPFTSETRTYPIDFVFPKSFTYNISYIIPEGYQVESLPESAKFVLPDNLGSFMYHIVNQGNMLQLRVISEINMDLVPSEYYDYIRGFYGEVIKKESEKVVLSKV
ncbi:DUF3857 domain-containing protein [Robertkochia flava]|uniref:DUF3857 domain-containing protein n=1 Tax=Robertkochia flava TaxID=3447986 RepID=UPI001CCF5C5F|nr:DUF3857 domain-containing protein [Robertkochia marina]